MEDRKLHDKIRARRKRRIKKRKANKFKVILLILAAIVFVFLFYKIITAVAGLFTNNDGDNVSQTVVEENVPEEKPEVKPEEKPPLSLTVDEEEPEKPTTDIKPVDTNITLEKKIENLEKKINSFISYNKIQKDELTVSYFNLDTNEGYDLNTEVEFGVGRSNNFIIAMEVYDLAAEKGYDLEEEITVIPDEEKKENTSPIKYAVKELVKVMLQTDSWEARQRLIQYIEDKTAKNWYDEVNSRYDINITHNNQMTGNDSVKMMRKLFELRKVTTEERVRYETDRIEKYLEIINFMRKQTSQSNISLDIMRKAQFSENLGNDYMDYTIMGYVLGNKRYVFVINSGHNNKTVVFDLLNLVNEWHDYYN